MKLRIKSDATRITIDMEETATLSDLYRKCQLVAPERAWYLSLNGMDGINASNDELIVNVGLVSGDLVHIVEKKNNQGLSTQLFQMGFEKGPINTVLNSFGATTLNDAIELLSMLSSTPEKLDSHEAKETPSNGATEQNTEGDAKAAHQDYASSILTPLFLQDGITDKFKMLFEQVKCVKESDYLFLLVHALVAEGGFQVYPNPTNTSDRLTESRHSVAMLPDNWKNSEMGLYRIKYTHYNSKDIHCFITATIIGKCLLVSGTLDEEDSSTHQVKLKISDFVISEHVISGLPEFIYSNLGKLSHKIKDGITTRIANDIRERVGLNSETVNICTLPIELQLRIVNWLDAVTICRLSQVTRVMHRLCSDETLWRRLLFREFGLNDLIRSTYREAFKGMYIQRREDELRTQRELESLRQPRTPLRPEFGPIGPDLIPFAGGMPSSIPGIIGGYQDLQPLGGFLPGGGHPVNPLQPSRPDLLGGRGRFPTRGDVRPPGARFDPYGPLPDDEEHFFSGRHSHPDMLRRPRFGEGDGFGGGGGGYGFI